MAVYSLDVHLPGLILSILLLLFAAARCSIFLPVPEEVDVTDTINACHSNWTLRWVADIESLLSVL